MKTNLFVRLLLPFVFICVSAGILSAVIRKPHAEKKATPEIVLSGGTTLREISEKYGFERPVLKKTLGLRDKRDLDKSLAELGIPARQAEMRLRKAAAFQAEESSKDWRKILSKFPLWLVFLAAAFVRLRAGRVTPRARFALLAAAVLVFGVLFGPDPSPMGTVKDAIVLFGRERVIFPPRLIALGIFLISVVLANKFICAWGCQFGTLQELIFRLNRDASDKHGLVRQIKVPFAVSNGVRIVFFAAFTVAAFVWSTDIVKPIDPFGIFNPRALGAAGAVFIAALLVASIFIYRPWCHFFCPFGLVGWLFEKISVNHVKVDYGKCIACESCAKACPTNVMNAILKQNGTVPDCFSCGTCMNVCPVGAVSFRKGKREKPPEGKFAS